MRQTNNKLPLTLTVGDRVQYKTDEGDVRIGLVEATNMIDGIWVRRIRDAAGTLTIALIDVIPATWVTQIIETASERRMKDRESESDTGISC